jgi:hypothetical protein
VVKEKPHAVFRRDGSDLVISRTVALRDALAGFKFSVQGLDGETIPVEVRDVVQPNATKVPPRPALRASPHPELHPLARAPRLTAHACRLFREKACRSARSRGSGAT